MYHKVGGQLIPAPNITSQAEFRPTESQYMPAADSTGTVALPIKSHHKDLTKMSPNVPNKAKNSIAGASTEWLNREKHNFHE